MIAITVRRVGLICVVLGLALAASLAAVAAASAADLIYWSTGSAVRSGPLGGGTGADLFGSEGRPTGEAIDLAAGKIYWADQNSNSIRVGSVNGTGAQNLFTGETNPIGVAIDPAAGKLYWADYPTGTIRVGNLNGTGAQDLFTGENGPAGVAIDPAAGKIYWVDFNSGLIRVGNLNGTGAQNLFTGETNPFGPAIDPAGGKIYWSDQGSSEIRVGNLNGGGAQNLFTGESGASGVALDPAAGKIYWADQGSGAIRVGNLAGGGAQDLFTGEINPVRPALLRAPQGAGAPVISGGSAPGSTLVCSTGSWAPDLLGAFLYHAPRGFSYAWQRSGAPVAANTNTITASSTGSYTCTVTATNIGGSATQTSAAFVVASVPALPTVKITKTKVSQSKRTATFNFTASAGAKLLQCAVITLKHGRPQGKPKFRACTSPKTYGHLKVGSYLFEVRAVSAAGTGAATSKIFTVKPAIQPKPTPSEPGEHESAAGGPGEHVG